MAAVYACAAQVYKYVGGESHLLGTGGVAVAQQGGVYALQCFSQQRELHCVIGLTPEWSFSLSGGLGGEDQAAVFLGFYDSEQVHWSLRLRGASEAAAVAAHLVIGCYAGKQKGGKPRGPIRPFCMTLGQPGEGPAVQGTEMVEVRQYHWGVDMSTGHVKVPPPSELPALQATASSTAEDQPYGREVFTGLTEGQVQAVLYTKDNGRVRIVIAEVVRVHPLAQPSVAAAVPEEAPVETTPVVTAPAPVPTPAPAAAPAVAAIVPQSEAPTALPATGLPSNDVIQTLLISQLTGQGGQFQAVHTKLDILNQKFDSFDLHSQLGAFHKIIAGFDAHNKEFYEKLNRREKDFLESEAKLNTERGEHQVTRQELQLAQRELRVQTELKVSYTAKATKWKTKCRALQSQKEEDMAELTHTSTEQVDDLRRQLKEEKEKSRELEAEHRVALKEAEEDGVRQGKASVIASAVDHGGAIEASGDASLEAVVQIRDTLRRREEELAQVRKDHMEEIVALQDKLVEEKEKLRDADKQTRRQEAKASEHVAIAREKEDEVEALKHEHAQDMAKLRDRLAQVGEGHLMMANENLKNEMKLKEKEIEMLREQLGERQSKEQAEAMSATKQKELVTDEYRELQTRQIAHDNELNVIQLQLVKEKEQAVGLQDRVTRLSMELSVAQTEKNDLEIQVDSLRDMLQDKKEAGAASGDAVMTRVKDIMSDVYYDIADQVDEETSYVGADVLKVVLAVIKDQTLQAVQQ